MEPDGWPDGARAASQLPRDDDDGRARAIAETSSEGTYLFRSCRGLELTHARASLVGESARARDVEDERCDGCRDDIGALQSRGARVRRAQELGERRSVS